MESDIYDLINQDIPVLRLYIRITINSHKYAVVHIETGWGSVVVSLLCRTYEDGVQHDA